MLSFRLHLIAAVAALLVAAPLGAQQAGGAGDDTPEYVPPSRGAPPGRLPGGTRGLQAMPLTALAPGHTGLTISAQPVLYYYTPASARPRLVLRPASDAVAPPLVDLELPAPPGAGIQSIDLAELGVRLAPAVEYKWTVSIAGEKRDTSGTVQRIEPSAELSRKLAGTSGRARYAALAREGIWYDALDEVSRAADSGAASALAGRHRAALLEQIGLKDIAQHERQLYP